MIRKRRSPKAQAIATLHRLAHEYGKQRMVSTPRRVLEDPRWADVVQAAQAAWWELRWLMDEPHDISSVVAICGFAAGESFAIVVAFSLPSGAIAGWLASRPKPEPVEGDPMPFVEWVIELLRWLGRR